MVTTDLNDVDLVITLRPSVSASDPEPEEVLPGPEPAKYLDDWNMGTRFLRAQPRTKELLAGTEYVDVKAAMDFVTRGGNIVADFANTGSGLLDVDLQLGQFLARYPFIGKAPRIDHAGKRDAAKFLIMCQDGPESYRKWENADHTRKVEWLRRGVVAGTHQDRTPYRLTTGSIVVMTWAEIEAIGREWCHICADMTPVVAAGLRARESKTLLIDAIHWWCDQRANQDAVDRLIAKCKRNGKYFALRADDKTPSVVRNIDRFDRRTYHDFGSGQTYDDFEIYCMLTGTDKGRFKWQVVDDYITLRGLPQRSTWAKNRAAVAR